MGRRWRSKFLHINNDKYFNGWLCPMASTVRDDSQGAAAVAAVAATSSDPSVHIIFVFLVYTLNWDALSWWVQFLRVFTRRLLWGSVRVAPGLTKNPSSAPRADGQTGTTVPFTAQCLLPFPHFNVRKQVRPLDVQRSNKEKRKIL